MSTFGFALIIRQLSLILIKWAAFNLRDVMKSLGKFGFTVNRGIFGSRRNTFLGLTILGQT